MGSEGQRGFPEDASAEPSVPIAGGDEQQQCVFYHQYGEAGRGQVAGG